MKNMSNSKQEINKTSKISNEIKRFFTKKSVVLILMTIVLVGFFSFNNTSAYIAGDTGIQGVGPAPATSAPTPTPIPTPAPTPTPPPSVDIGTPIQSANPPVNSTTVDITPPSPTPVLKTQSNSGACIPSDSFIPSDACIARDGFSAFSTMINTIINRFILLSVSIAAITFSYAGAQMLMHPENPAKREEAIDMFQKTAIGLLVVLGAWLFVHTIVTALLSNSTGPTGALRFLSN